jgi:hypothetical protein
LVPVEGIERRKRRKEEIRKKRERKIERRVLGIYVVYPHLGKRTQ